MNPRKSPEFVPVAVSESPATACAETAGSDSHHTVRPLDAVKVARRQSAQASAQARAKTYPETSSPPPPQRHKAAAAHNPGPPRISAIETQVPETSGAFFPKWEPFLNSNGHHPSILLAYGSACI